MQEVEVLPPISSIAPHITMFAVQELTSFIPPQEKRRTMRPSKNFVLVLDVKPRTAEEKMADIHQLVFGLEYDAVSWKESSIETIAFGIQKLRLTCMFDTSKTTQTEILTHLQADLMGSVQSIDVVACYKLPLF